MGGLDDKEKVLAKKLLKKVTAFETMYLHLSMLVLLPGNAGDDLQAVTSTLEDLEELKECFSNFEFE